MRNKDLIQLLKSNPEMKPSEDLKSKILTRAQAEQKAVILTDSIPTGAKKRSILHRMPRVFYPLAASFLLICLLTGGASALYFEDYETVYLDVNPSVAMTVNRFDIVNKVTYLNSDAEEAFSKTNLKGKKVEQAVLNALDACKAGGMLTDSSEIYISSFSEKNKNHEKLTEQLTQKTRETQNCPVNSAKIGREEQIYAKEYGLSPAKYQLIQQILERSGDAFSFEELKEMNMAELKRISEFFEEQSTTATPGGSLLCFFESIDTFVPMCYNIENCMGMDKSICTFMWY